MEDPTLIGLAVQIGLYAFFLIGAGSLLG